MQAAGPFGWSCLDAREVLPGTSTGSCQVPVQGPARYLVPVNDEGTASLGRVTVGTVDTSHLVMMMTPRLSSA